MQMHSNTTLPETAACLKKSYKIKKSIFSIQTIDEEIM